MDRDVPKTLVDKKNDVKQTTRAMRSKNCMQIQNEIVAYMMPIVLHIPTYM